MYFDSTGAAYAPGLVVDYNSTLNVITLYWSEPPLTGVTLTGCDVCFRVFVFALMYCTFDTDTSFLLAIQAHLHACRSTHQNFRPNSPFRHFRTRILCQRYMAPLWAHSARSVPSVCMTIVGLPGRSTSLALFLYSRSLRYLCQQRWVSNQSFTCDACSARPG